MKANPTHTPLAHTGAADLAKLLAGGLALVLAGALLLIGAIRRRRA